MKHLIKFFVKLQYSAKLTSKHKLTWIKFFSGLRFLSCTSVVNFDTFQLKMTLRKSNN